MTAGESHWAQLYPMSSSGGEVYVVLFDGMDRACAMDLHAGLKDLPSYIGLTIVYRGDAQKYIDCLPKRLRVDDKKLVVYEGTGDSMAGVRDSLAESFKFDSVACELDSDLG